MSTDKGDTSSSMQYADDLIQKFSAQDKTYGVSKFIQDVDENAVIFGWTPLQQLIVARRSLTGTAALWLRAERPYKSWDDMKGALNKEFPDTLDGKAIHETMAARRRKKGESCLDYLLTMRELGKRGKLPDYVAIQYIIDGIEDLEMNKIMLYGATTYGELKEKVKIYEICKSNMTQSQHEVKKNRPKPAHNSNVKKCYSCGEENHVSSSCPHRHKGNKCFRCNQFGHIAAHCTLQIPRNGTKDGWNHHGGGAGNGNGATTTRANSLIVKVGNRTNDSICLKSGSKMAASVNSGDTDSSRQVVTDENVNHIKGQGKPLKIISICNRSVYALVDSGSDLNLVTEDCYMLLGAQNYTKCEIGLTGLGSTQVKTTGYFTTDIVIDGECYNNVVLHVVPRDAMNFSIILGQELLKDLTVVMDGSRIQLWKRNESWFRKFPSDVFVSDVVGYVADPVLQQEVKHLVGTYKPNKVREAPIQLKIVLKDDIPVAQRPRRLAIAEQKEVDKQVTQWLDDGIIRVSFSEYASPIVLVKKKDGSTRICVDYRRINEKMVKDEYPLPIIDDHIDKLSKAKVFSTLDLKNGYFHLSVHEESIKYTSFVTHNGQYEFLKAPFGLSICPKVFTRFINIIFRDLVAKGYLLIFIDDLIIISEDEEQGVQRLEEVLMRASQYGLEVNWSKTQLIQRRVEYLGHIVENGTVRPSPDKTDAVVRFPQPKTLKQLRGFVGLSSYFRKFIPNYALVARPLTDLLKKDVDFIFDECHKTAFNELKVKLATSPVLKIYDPELQTELHTDASMLGYSAVLLQKCPEDGNLHPVHYMSRKTSEAEQKYTSYELEALAIIEGVKKFRTYLYGIKFKIITDCKAFEMTLKKKDLCTRVARWVLLLQEYDYEISHRSGSQMRHVDALSRAPFTGVVTRALHDKLKRAQEGDEGLKAIMEILKEREYQDYAIEGGILYKGTLLVIPKDMENDILQRVHAVGHFGKKKMTEMINKEYFIKDLSRKIDEFIVTCVPCLLATKKAGKQEGFLHSIDKDDIPLYTLHLDHIGPMMETKKAYNYILTMVDAFTKFVWLFPVKGTTAKETIDKLKIHQQCFGNPCRFITDRGAAFTSNDFKAYCEEENINHVSITTGVPRGNGQVEIIHRTMISVLTKICISDQSLWYKHVARLQTALNSTYQRSIDTTPFELLLGAKMRTKDDVEICELLQQEDRDAYAQTREKLRESAKAQILKVQEENRRTYNRGRKESQRYQVGDQVAIKRTQYGPCLKLKAKFLGPYKVVAVKGNDRYDVEKVQSSSEGPGKTSSSADYMKPWPCT